MSLPGFTADTTLYRSTHTYRPFAGNTPERTTGLALQSLVDWYDCSGKSDGNYIHPTDCTKFISCVAQTHAYERDCAACHVDPVRCPTGRTHYDHPSDACLWANEAGCVTESG
jgi:hypothetical protein